jgi:hypothetical protein
MMKRMLPGLAILVATIAVASQALAQQDKAATAKERAEKAKQAAREKAMKSLRAKILPAFGPQQEGHFLFALEELSGPKVTSVTIRHQEGRDSAVDEAVEFLIDANKQVRRSFQVIARLEATEIGSQRAQAHQAKLQGFVDVRLRDVIFSRDACYSDIAPGSMRSINQGLAEGTVVRYLPFR